MNQIIVLKNEKSWKSLLIEDDKLLLIDKSYDTTEEFYRKYEEKSIFRNKKEIAINEISRVSHPEKEATKLKIEFGKKTEVLEFENGNELQELAIFLSNKLSLKPVTTTVSTFKAITNPLIGLGISVVLGWVLYSEATTLEAGGTIEITGRRKLYKKLFVWVSETLGSTGVLTLAIIATLTCLYFMYKNYTNPPNEVVYE